MKTSKIGVFLNSANKQNITLTVNKETRR